MKRSDVSTSLVLRTVTDVGPLGAFELLARGFPRKVVLAAFRRDTDAGLLEYGTSEEHPWLTPEGEEALQAIEAEERLALYIARAAMPVLARAVDELTAAVERLVEYGQRAGLTKEAAEEVVTVWSRETTLSMTADEAAFHAPLWWRAQGHAWEPSRLPLPELQARSVIGLMRLFESGGDAHP